METWGLCLPLSFFGCFFFGPRFDLRYLLRFMDAASDSSVFAKSDELIVANTFHAGGGTAISIPGVTRETSCAR